ncbi:MAG: tetratricopeptide repeat protein [Gimesia chilikensis]
MLRNLSCIACALVWLICCGCQAVPISTLTQMSGEALQGETTPQTSETSSRTERTSPFNERANQLVDQALQHYSQGELQQARSLLASAREIDPGHIGTFEIEAQLSYDMGDRKQFLQSLRAIRAASPQDAAKQSAIGTLFFQAGQTQEGIACLKRAIALKPHEENYSLKLAAFLEQTSRTDEAHEVLLRALHRTPGSKRLPIALGRVCEVNQQWSEASVYYAMVINHLPENHVWRKHRARCLYHAGKYQEAFEQFSICQEADRELLSLSEKIAFGDTALRLGDLEKAQQLFDEISAAHQHQLLHVEVLRGLCAINRGQTTDAKAIIATARKKWPADPTLLEVAALLPAQQTAVR